ncbi:uncharacterized protein LOC142629247 [Castanea sativa]|uniref:uncharacterized protein LOC142629247 n=1 Tax=Castanea sativa TaxID=21020 RepID=UPI003F64DA94
MDLIIEFLAESQTPDDVKEAARVRRTAALYWLSADRKLYRRSFEGPYLQCLRPNQAEELLTELHKGAEAEALANIQDVDVKRFVWRNIITRFGVPKSLVSNNGLQFDSKAFQEFYNNLGIQNWYSTPAYLQSNSQVGATNKTIVNGLKKRAVELAKRTLRNTIIRLVEYQQKLAERYNRSVRKREFAARDLVLRKVIGNKWDANAGKLAPSWEGPYRVTATAGAGAYYLEDLEEKPLHRPWNVHNLKKFYH